MNKFFIFTVLAVSIFGGNLFSMQHFSRQINRPTPRGRNYDVPELFRAAFIKRAFERIHRLNLSRGNYAQEERIEFRNGLSIRRKLIYGLSGYGYYYY